MKICEEADISDQLEMVAQCNAGRVTGHRRSALRSAVSVRKGHATMGNPVEERPMFVRDICAISLLLSRIVEQFPNGLAFRV